MNALNRGMDGSTSSSGVLTRLLAGDISELNQLFSHSRAQIRAMVERRLDRRLLSRVDASDIVQEAFVRASQQFETYLRDPSIPPLLWLRLIGKQLVAETHRKHFRAKRSPLREQHQGIDQGKSLVHYLTDSVLSVGSTMRRAEVACKVRERLKELPALDREVLELRLVDGYGMKEAAEALDLPLETAKKRYQRAISRFRELAEDLA